jgi:hypothetical protein
MSNVSRPADTSRRGPLEIPLTLKFQHLRATEVVTATTVATVANVATVAA